ncbi:hypothetical protein CXF72_00115 [Psychromonas sp. MB-3u-54]|uniref:hypothetical protein n=1 Tax=Psychromonas sp. MB-3u-54 TaxID=2058319 RepID=UPI000C33F3CD|nr:hypothetical protein [Psychromonas sp. MB-3u-54]PKH04580.1 hypothetical protein CXF72_00115 [Psychromonas sp. MB-3u-54]
MINNTEVKFLKAVTVMQTKDFTYITWKELISLCSDLPATDFRTAKEAKTNSAVIGAHDGSAKTKLEVLAHNNFTLLRLDLDDIDYSIDDVQHSLSTLSIQSYIIHTTASHRQGNNKNRFRVYIEIKNGVDFDTWSLIQTYLSYDFEADDCATRPNQVMYLPFKSELYEVRIRSGQPLDLSDQTTQLYKGASEHKKNLDKELLALQEQSLAAANKPMQKQEIVGNQVSIICMVNSSFSWDMLLSSAGFKKVGLRWLSPNSKSGAAAGVILTSNTDGKERLYSHSTTDGFDGQSLDKFDFLMISQYGNDKKKALREIAEAYFPYIDKHNKREYAVNKQNLQITREMEVKSC